MFRGAAEAEGISDDATVRSISQGPGRIER